MENENVKTKSMNPVISKCLKHLEVIGADDKTKQIVYMYMKTLEDELMRSREKEYGRQSS